MSVVHIEKGSISGHEMFCGMTIPPAGASVSYVSAISPQRHDFVSLDDWQTRFGRITKATCQPCRAAVLKSVWRVAREELEADDATKAQT